MVKILLSDGTHKNTLAILRALGTRYDFYLLTPANKFFTLCKYSKYVRHTIEVNSEPESHYWKELKEILASGKYDVFLPVGLKSYIVASKHREEILNFTNILVPSWDKMKIAVNKNETVAFAEKINIPVPKSYVISNIDDINALIEKLERYPVVLKSQDETGSVKYANSPKELEVCYRQLEKKGKKVLAQEFITGFGCGFYAVCKNGEPVAIFMHRRIKEFPVTGGPSAVAESFFDKKLLDYGLRICKALDWEGPIMAEFKYSPTSNDFVLIELNPKLWGSLALTIAAGVNIPEIIINLAMGKEVKSVMTYRYVRYRWVFPDEFKVLCSGGESIREFFMRGKDVYTNLDFRDPLPTLFQIFRGIFEGFLILTDKRRRYPHGKPSKEI